MGININYKNALILSVLICFGIFMTIVAEADQAGHVVAYWAAVFLWVWIAKTKRNSE